MMSLSVGAASYYSLHPGGGRSLPAALTPVISSSIRSLTLAKSSRRDGHGRRRRRAASSSSSSSSLDALFFDPHPPHDVAPSFLPSTSTSSSFLFGATTTTSRADPLTGWNPPRNDVAPLVAFASTATASSPDRPPTEDEIGLLRRAFSYFYGAERDLPEAYAALTKCIDVWESTRQGGDEIAGLFRVRGDLDMAALGGGVVRGGRGGREIRGGETSGMPVLIRAIDRTDADYSVAIRYLEGPDGGRADPEELPASRARAVRSMGSSATYSQALRASKDYESYFLSTSRIDENMGDDDAPASANGDGDRDGGTSFSDAVVDGIRRNPYAAWEWGMVDRVARNYDRASEIHGLAASAFDEIGDRPRSVICALDRGLDLASGLDAVDYGGGGKRDEESLAKTRKALEDAISSTVDVEGRDVGLLQRVVAKEGEARVALSGILWNSDSRGSAESQFGTACARLDELNADYRTREADRVSRGGMPSSVEPRGASGRECQI
ncbi:hypothetical protein ACHAW5_002433 [Stephanodiscus triporus]|uniref:Uncharacterized protein n=1 Tax=Stephanodiscus triporus TaxID=2934178 RepID=A0ABD3P0A0_9STRA